MKKIIKVVLIILAITSMLFILTGCGKDKEVFKNITEPQIEEKSKVEKSKAKFSMGEWKGDTYENEFLGLKFNLPEGWTRQDDEQIAKMMNLDKESLKDDQKLSRLDDVCYIMVWNPNTGENILVMSSKRLTGTIENYISTLNEEGSEIIGPSKEKVADTECDTVTIKGKSSGVEFTQKHYIYKVDNYVVAIVASSGFEEDSINEKMKSFEKLVEETKVVKQEEDSKNKKDSKKSNTEFSMGEWKGDTYENEFLGLKFNLPQGWERDSDEEISKYNKEVNEEYNNEDFWSKRLLNCFDGDYKNAVDIEVYYDNMINEDDEFEMLSEMYKKEIQNGNAGEIYISGDRWFMKPPSKKLYMVTKVVGNYSVTITIYSKTKSDADKILKCFE